MTIELIKVILDTRKSFSGKLPEAIHLIYLDELYDRNKFHILARKNQLFYSINTVVINQNVDKCENQITIKVNFVSWTDLVSFALLLFFIC